MSVAAHNAATETESAADSPSLPAHRFSSRPIRSFVLRQGRLSPAQQRYLDEMMPKIGIPYRPERLDLAAAFGRAAPKILEIGFGMGEATAKIAASHPENDYLGVEVHGPGVGALCKLIVENNLTNLLIIRHDAVEVLREMIPDGALDRVHVFFPDPWHKARHYKRRLIQPDFVALVAAKLSPGGILHCATDWEHYAEWMLEILSASALKNTADGFAPRPAYRLPTKFETRGTRLGHGVWDIVFRRPQ
ncbi:MAG: tRNA (guanosine(46)-N7)-methyltransferase TrmB [Azoarcus sp.]|jgi:tRNA (guanine-N7-)-methyltransferase|nr:tRNA (guanosine(46)-N7)-methyltransferase TrmB [Azoarcus sp.]